MRLKIIVTYDKDGMLSELTKDVLRRVDENKDSAEWLVIGGIMDSAEEFVDLNKWLAYLITNSNGRTPITRIWTSVSSKVFRSTTCLNLGGPGYKSPFAINGLHADGCLIDRGPRESERQN